MILTEPLADLFTSSRLMILDFADIPSDAAPEENIALFFKDCEQYGTDPRLPENRQAFNNTLLEYSSMRYVVSRYGEDRSAMLAADSRIAQEGRTLHMGVDIFCRDLAAVFAPCTGTIVRTGFEDEAHSYGHYLILQPDEDLGIYFFFGHLSKELPPLGKVRAGQQIAQLGDYRHNENGGWSRHLHLQCITELPPDGLTPDGYATKAAFSLARKRFPDPFTFFPQWQLG